jgi:hypothetical protein
MDVLPTKNVNVAKMKDSVCIAPNPDTRQFPAPSHLRNRRPPSLLLLCRLSLSARHLSLLPTLLVFVRRTPSLLLVLALAKFAMWFRRRCEPAAYFPSTVSHEQILFCNEFAFLITRYLIYGEN